MLKDIIQSLRIKQWIKNLLIFTPLFFSGQIDKVNLTLTAIQGFLAFSLIASCTYLINDYLDKKYDSQHPKKKNRPITRGFINFTQVLLMVILLGLTSFIWSFFIDKLFFSSVVFYFSLTLAYHLWLKNIPVIDILTVTMGYLVRIGAGSLLVKVEPSPWLLLVTFSLSLFLVVSKRMGELKQLNAKLTRNTLKSYSERVLSSMLYTSVTLTITSYALYAFTSTNNPVVNRTALWFSLMPVIFGIYRYLFLVEQENKGEEPEEELFRDIPLLFSVIVWAFLMTIAFYLPRI